MFSEGKETNDIKYKLFTGLENFKVTAINPSKEELEAMGIKREDEPVYLTTEQEEDQEFQRLRIEVFIDNDNEENSIKNSLSFFLENRPVKAATGSQEFINKYGQTAYLHGLENIPKNMSWFSTEKARPSYRNERFLINFFRNYLNLSAKNGDAAYLDNLEQMFTTGDVAPLRAALKKMPNNKVKILCGVKTLEQTTDEGATEIRNYQNFYVRDFLRSYTKAGTKPFNDFRKGVLDYKAAGGAPTTDYGDIDTMVFTEWDENQALSTDTAQEDTSAEANW